MRLNKFDKKVRLSYLLPYGLISPLALELNVGMPADAYCDYRPDKSMQDRIDDCHRAHKRRMEAVNMMAKYGYIEEVSLKYGSAHWEEVRMYRLTRAGLYFLTNTPDDTVEQKRIESAYKPEKRILKNNTYLDMSESAVQTRNELYAQAKRKDLTSEDRALFNELFETALENEEITILASEPVLAQNVQIPSKLRSHQQYRLWRIANVEALFKTNRFLTSIDRRPLQFTHSGEKKEKAKPDQLDIPTFVRRTLNQWYEDNPCSYTFYDPIADTEKRRSQDWVTTPAFYSVQEIPGFEGIMEDTNGMQIRGANNIMRYSFVGLAVGRKINYIVYHTKPTKTPWSETIERATALAVKKAIDIANGETKNSIENAANNTAEIDAKNTIKNALMVCPTIHQFAALFSMAKLHMPKRWAKEKRVGRPYQSVCIVPLNHSGSMQLRCLMLSTPMEYEAILANNFLTQAGFTERPPGKEERDNIYKLSYNKRPVLLAHAMEFQKLYWAMEDYLEGKQFYVACYPEQVKFIQKIMPEAEFL